ncbi:MAG: exodeoxyribonuclease VII small subunit [Planctomycetota bacterium]
MTEKKRKGPEPTYQEASTELETILQEVESGEIDLDLLSEKVERAAALLALCRERLAATETKVKKVVADLHASAAADAGDGEADAAESDE